MPQLPATTVVPAWLTLGVIAGSTSSRLSSWVCGSMKPGATTLPRASISLAADAPAGSAPSATMRSPATARSPATGGAPVPSISWALRMIRSARIGGAGMGIPALRGRARHATTAPRRLPTRAAAPVSQCGCILGRAGPGCRRFRHAAPQYDPGTAMTAAAPRRAAAPAAPAPIPFIDLQAQRRRIAGAVERAIARVLEHGQFIMGPELAELERRLADYCGVKHPGAGGNGTDALRLLLMAH